MTTPALAPETVTAIQAAIAFAKGGDLARARATAEAALAQGRDLAELHGLAGMLASQNGDSVGGLTHFRAAWTAKPGDVVATANLSRALIASGAADEVLTVATDAATQADPSHRLLRLRAYALQLTGQYEEAAVAYRTVVAATPDDFESWNNLGNALTALADHAGAVDALSRAAKLRPDIAPLRLNHAAALADTGDRDGALAALQHCAEDFPDDAKPLVELAAHYKQLSRDDDALAALEEAARREPGNAEMHVKLGTERNFGWDMTGAETSYRRALTLAPHEPDTWLLLANLIEHDNRAADFAPLIAEARDSQVDAGTLGYMNALALRREKKFAEGLAALAAVPADLDPSGQALLSGQFHDQLGNAAEAFASFTELNEHMKGDPSQPVERAAEYRAALRAERALVTPDWYAGWTPDVPPDPRPSPAFLLGFPRSGTTLLDTMLMGHPRVAVLEERPPVARIEAEIGGMARLAALSAVDVARLRDLYFEEAAKHVDFGPDTLLIDKFPLHLNKVPYIHRLFPDARFILALRHPCDVVLSCFITNFRLNSAMSNFLDLGTTAEVYDLSFGFWEQARAIMPVSSHAVRYEDMVADVEATLRPLFDYLGLDWTEEAMDHRKTAASRGVIATASYAQVTEPIYQRAKGRWERYRDQLAPVMPVLEPWVKKHGYA